jgi:hypothetical protein
MAPRKLTPKQRRLQKELEQMGDLLHLDHHSILEYPPHIRTTKLEAMIRWLARGAVIQAYTFVDELLADQICWFFFGRQRPFWQLWQTKKFRSFNHHILQDMYPLEKLRLIRAFRELPRKLVSDIQDLNTLRNALAHAFFPENLKKAKPTWKGKSIFSLATLTAFETDIRELQDFFLSEPAYRRQGRVIRVRRSKTKQ